VSACNEHCLNCPSFKKLINDRSEKPEKSDRGVQKKIKGMKQGSNNHSLLGLSTINNL
jgi:hypothetical protein